MNEISIYQAENGTIEVRLEQYTVWLSQAQMVELFGRDQSVVSRHIRNALSEGEVVEKSNMQKMHIAYFNYPEFSDDCQNIGSGSCKEIIDNCHKIAQSVVAGCATTAEVRSNLREVLI